MQSLDRTKIIQTLLDTYKNKNYLEIGVQEGLNFAQITANYKIGVDPLPIHKQVRKVICDDVKYYQMTSDEFFTGGGQNYAGTMFDVIFVDGLHEAEQAYRDVCNALKFLAPDGTIVLHDCKPESEVMQLPLRIWEIILPKIRGDAWNGDVWKACVRLRALHKDLQVFTLDCNSGCAIITKGQAESVLDLSALEINAMDYNDLAKDLERLLNLKRPEYFYDWMRTRE